jgi:prepilin-type N-terminal cleavage/methylation domain-containing protein
MDRTLSKRLHRCHPRRAPGFALLELVVVVIIIGILLVAAITRLLPYLDEAERVAVLTVESQLKSTLVMEAAQRIVRGQSASLAELEGSNPMSLLLEMPKAYVGVRGASDEVPDRHWYFDRDRDRLVYKTGEPWALDGREQMREDPQFEVRVMFEDRDADGIFDATKDELYGVRLLRMAGANWLTGGNRL